MAARKRLRIRARTTARARRGRRGRVALRGRSGRRELVEVLNAQLESGEELRNAKVAVATEPAFVFRA
jgi:hypothetical protein